MKCYCEAWENLTRSNNSYSLWFCGLLACPNLCFDWLQDNKHSPKYHFRRSCFCGFDSTSLILFINQLSLGYITGLTVLLRIQNTKTQKNTKSLVYQLSSKSKLYTVKRFKHWHFNGYHASRVIYIKQPWWAMQTWLFLIIPKAVEGWKVWLSRHKKLLVQ